MRSLLLRWSGYLAVAVAFAIACAFLSQWQFARNAERTSQIAIVEANYGQPPVALAEVIAPGGEFIPTDEWRQVRMRGHYVTDDQLLVRNRPHGGTRAFEVVVPFATADGQVIIVNRGWVPPGRGDAPDAVPQPHAGEMEIVVRLRPGEESPRSGRGAPEGQVATLHLPTIAEVTGPLTNTSAYGQLVSESPAAPTAPYLFASPTEDPGPHLSYAIQWILFAVMGFIFIFSVIRTEVRRAREEKEGRPAPSPRRRRDRDSAAEDALLDG